MSDAKVEFVVIQNLCSFDIETGVVTFVLENRGYKDVSGVNNLDARVVFEVTKNADIAGSVGSLISTDEIASKNGETYYPKSMDGTYVNELLQSSYNDFYSNTNYTIDISGDNYIRNSPPLKTRGRIVYKFKGNFEKGKSYIICA